MLKKIRLSDALVLFITISMLFSLVQTSYQAFQATSVTLKHQAWFLALEIILGLVLVYLPKLVAKLLKFSLPEVIYIFFLLFIYGSVYLGTVNHFYQIPYWDKGLHLISGPLLSAFGIATLDLFFEPKIKLQLKAFFISFYAVAFAVLGGVLWEFYEFTCDSFGMNLQRYMKAGHPLIGRAALMDTMGDLWMDFIGALLFAIFVYYKLKKNQAWLQKFEFSKEL